jgi:GMP synthase-like glutamine amidotransferase
MNDASTVPTQSLEEIVARFCAVVRKSNPSLPCKVIHASPRRTTGPIPRQCELYVATGGSGSPDNAVGTTWGKDFGRLLDGVVASATGGGAGRQALFAICYSFELIVRHFGIARVEKRPMRKFGVAPVYPTDDGRKHPLLSAFGERLFAFEYRSWEAIELDEARLRQLGGTLLARESRDGVSDGNGLLAFDVAPGIEAVQFHPEADPESILAWLTQPAWAATLEATYGALTYAKMLRAASDPRRMPRTYTEMLPGWLQRQFNQLAAARGYAPICETPFARPVTSVPPPATG